MVRGAARVVILAPPLLVAIGAPAACNVTDGLTLPAPEGGTTPSGSSSGTDPPGTDCTTTSATCTTDGLSSCSAGGKRTLTPCPLGCTTAPSAHCAVFMPSTPVEAADLERAGTGDVTLATNTTIDTGAATIRGVTGGFATRTTARTATLGGVSVPYTVTIFVFENLTIGPDVVVIVKGPNSAILVAKKVLTIDGVIDARGECTGSEGGPGGFAASTGPGKGGSGAGVGSTDSGGGGGAFGAAGGKGGPSGGGVVGEPGVAYGSPNLDAFVGGSGGASGFNGAGGGGGGGAIGVVAFEAIRFGTGATVGINAGGCGGISGGNSGGGGGSGGAIFVESPSIAFPANAILAANGGGGGAASNAGAARSHGQLTLLAAPGAGSGAGTGGAGAPGTGGDGTNPGSAGGGGGGSVGWIRLSTVPNPALAGKTSPPLGGAQATVGTIATR